MLESKIPGVLSTVPEFTRFLGFETVSVGEWFTTFCRITVPSKCHVPLTLVLQDHVPEHTNPQAVGSLHVVGCDTSKGCIE